MSERFDLGWQKFFAACGMLFAVFTFVGLVVFWPNPPAFDLTAQQTASFYIANQTGLRIGITVITVGMALLLAWSVQFGLMLSRLEGGSHSVSAVTIASLVASPVLLSFDLAIFAIAAFRPAETSPEVTRALSDVAWISSQLIWPMLAVSMVLSGILIIKTRDKPGALPAWLGYAGILCAVVEFGQAPIIFTKTGPFAGDGIGSWYAATYTWGPWIVAASFAMYRTLSAQAAPQAAAAKNQELAQRTAAPSPGAARSVLGDQS